MTSPSASSRAAIRFSTCDLCDSLKSDSSGATRWLPGSLYRSYGGQARFAGPVATVRCLDDNTPVKAAVESFGAGRVLVVDGGASLRRALLGGNLAASAAKNGWAGVLVHGAVRDLEELRAAAVGIFALGHVPMPTERREPGLADLPVQIEGMWIRPGDWLYADEDGVVITPSAVHPAG
ncbi:regulator of ribonuclease activity A [Mitsuaria sp. PDC51]|uniref:ribonuclease E activity regulator RraA n=1 Tax=unclassified Roseateles TaxID=2626991 RepID=UPI0008DFCD7F|nr:MULTISPECIES: ribonuclease E activity regulator RraA [unclassified Roseateles]MBB3282290.1 regulator of ribonuclease activity A [Mitsuaria sp. BK037]SFR97187.1 regulator of ribonuclease activity A [Mitsuaria sp. PDC51]